MGAEGDAGLDDLLARDAPDPFAVIEAGGFRASSRSGPASSATRCACRPAPSCASRPTSIPRPGRRRLGLVPGHDRGAPGEERELWAARHRPPRSRSQPRCPWRCPGTAGDIVRVGLHVGGAPGARFTWGTLGRTAHPGPRRQRPARAGRRPPRRRRARRTPCGRRWPDPTSCSSSSTPRGRGSSAATATARPTTPGDRPHRRRGRRVRAGLHARRLHPGRHVVGLDVGVSRPPPQRRRVLVEPAQGPAHAGRDAHRRAGSRPPASWPTRWRDGWAGSTAASRSSTSLFQRYGSGAAGVPAGAARLAAGQQGPAVLRLPRTSASRISRTTRSRPSTRASGRTAPSPRRRAARWAGSPRRTRAGGR